MGNIVKEFELSLCNNEQRKIDAMIREQNKIYNVVNGKLIKIYKSKVSKKQVSGCKTIKEKSAIFNNVLLFVNKKGEEVRGFSEFSLTKYVAHLFSNTLVNANTRNTVSSALASAWSGKNGFLFKKEKNGKPNPFPRFRTKKNGNLSNCFAWNVGVKNYRKDTTKLTYMVNKENGDFCLDFNNRRAKVQDKKRKVQGHFKFKTNKDKSINYRDNLKKFEWFDKDLDVATIGINCKEIRGKKRYFLSVTYALEDVKAQPIDETLRIGVDPNMKNFAIYSSQTGCKGFADTSFEKWLVRMKNKKHNYEKKYAIAAEKANPKSYFNLDGSRKEKPLKLTTTTEEMVKLRTKINTILRRITKYRNNIYGAWVNQLIAEHPSVVKYEHLRSNALAHRSKEGMGKRGKKKRFGKSIQIYAPSSFELLLKNKCVQNGINFIEVDATKTACTQFDPTDGERHPEYSGLSVRSHKTSDGKEHSRDLLSAYNISCCSDEENINIQLAKDDYTIFCEQENVEINRLAKANVFSGLR